MAGPAAVRLEVGGAAAAALHLVLHLHYYYIIIIVKRKLYHKLGLAHSLTCGAHSLTCNQTFNLSGKAQDRLARPLKIIVKRKLYPKLGLNHSLTRDQTFNLSLGNGPTDYCAGRPTPRHYIPFPKGVAAPHISEAVVRFETISDLKDDLKEILFSIYCSFSKS